MELKVYNQEGKTAGNENVPEALFSVPFNNDLVYQVYKIKLGNARNNIAHTKTRADVRGGGRKPWRQKGTGNARHGSIRSPIWVGGGVTFGPRNDRVYKKSINKKMAQKALLSLLSEKARQNKIFVVESLSFKDAKTKDAANLLSLLKLSGASTVVYGTQDDVNFVRTFRNIPKVKAADVARVNILDILNHQNCVFSKNALNKIIKTYANTKPHIQKGQKAAADAKEGKEGTAKRPAKNSATAGKAKK